MENQDYGWSRTTSNKTSSYGATTGRQGIPSLTNRPSIRNPYVKRNVASSSGISEQKVVGDTSTNDGDREIRVARSKTVENGMTTQQVPDAPVETRQETIQQPNDSKIIIASSCHKAVGSTTSPTDETATETWQRRLPSYNLSFGSAEILTVTECLQYADLYRGHSVRVTGILVHHHLHSPSPHIVEEASHASGFAMTMMCLHIREPVVYSSKSRAAFSIPQSMTPSDSSPAMLAASGQAQPEQGGKESKNETSTLNTSTKKQPRLLVRRRNASLLNKLSETSVPGTSGLSKSNFTTPKRNPSLTTISLSGSMAPTKFGTQAGNNPRKRNRNSVSSSVRLDSVATATPLGKEQIGVRLAPDCHDNNDCLCLWAHPKHVAGLYTLSVGGLIVVTGQLQLLDSESAFTSRNLPDEENLTAMARELPFSWRLPCNASASAGSPVNAGDSASTRPFRTVYLNARWVRNVAASTDLTLYKRALKQRRRHLLLQWERRQRYRIDLMRPQDNAEEGVPRLLQGCGPPPYDVNFGNKDED